MSIPACTVTAARIAGAPFRLVLASSPTVRPAPPMPPPAPPTSMAVFRYRRYHGPADRRCCRCCGDSPHHDDHQPASAHLDLGSTHDQYDLDLDDSDDHFDSVLDIGRDDPPPNRRDRPASGDPAGDRAGHHADSPRKNRAHDQRRLRQTSHGKRKEEEVEAKSKGTSKGGRAADPRRQSSVSRRRRARDANVHCKQVQVAALFLSTPC